MFIVPPVTYNHNHQNQQNHKSNLLLFNKTRKVEVENMNVRIITFEIEKHKHETNFSYRINEKIKEIIGSRPFIDYQIIPIETEYSTLDKKEMVTKFMVVLTLKN